MRYHHDPLGKAIADLTAAGVTGLSLLQIIPAVASVFTILWMAIRIFELTTGTDFSESAFARFLTRRGKNE